MTVTLLCGRKMRYHLQEEIGRGVVGKEDLSVRWYLGLGSRQLGRGEGTGDEKLNGVYVSTFHAPVGRYQGEEERGGYVKHTSPDRRVLR